MRILAMFMILATALLLRALSWLMSPRPRISCSTDQGLGGLGQPDLTETCEYCGGRTSVDSPRCGGCGAS